jgi:hypothetical protein
MAVVRLVKRGNEAAMHSAEYGARVKLDDRYEYDNPRGTIVGITVWTNEEDPADKYLGFTVRCDMDGTERAYTSDMFTVTMSPSDAAERLTHSMGGAEEALNVACDVVEIGGCTRGLEIYQGALVVELYKIYAYANGIVRRGVGWAV